jgi:5-methyltetrahydrofolate--homocysteine methyltransferase
MPIWKSQDLDFGVDAVLRGQGAEPGAIRVRSPRLVDLAERALEEGTSLLEPTTLFRELDVETLRHERLILDGGSTLSGTLIAEHLGPADRVISILCTVGDALEDHAGEVSQENIVYGLALDGVGSAAVEALANAACKHFEDQAVELGFQSSIPISPGMVGWPVEKGQPEIFEILEPEQVNVQLTEYGLMKPRKSLTMVLGLGPTMKTGGRTCDFCAMRETCRYQDHYDPHHA